MIIKGATLDCRPFDLLLFQVPNVILYIIPLQIEILYHTVDGHITRNVFVAILVTLIIL